jgi:thymidylate synthase (FAD)
VTRKIDTTCAITRATSPYLESILGHAFPVLDHGFIRVIDWMGDDAAIVQMARTSYGEGTKATNDDRGLIRYLVRHAHTSPLEGCEIKLHLKMPIFVARQWIRHRMASLNEVSGRYSVLPSEFYVPERDRLGRQSTTNKQGTGDGYSVDQQTTIMKLLIDDAGRSFELYETLCDDDTDLARELARINLPLSTYTEFYWKIDLHNLLHFLKLRCDSHAQYEIRAYADIIQALVEMWTPATYRAWVDYRRDAVTFSRMEMDALRRWIAATYPTDPEYGGSGPVDLLEGVSQRERDEFVARFKG